MLRSSSAGWIGLYPQALSRKYWGLANRATAIDALNRRRPAGGASRVEIVDAARVRRGSSAPGATDRFGDAAARVGGVGQEVGGLGAHGVGRGAHGERAA